MKFCLLFLGATLALAVAVSAAPQADEIALGSLGKRIKHFACVSSVVTKAIASGEFDKLKAIAGTPINVLIALAFCESDGRSPSQIKKCRLETLKGIPKEVVEAILEINKETGDKIKEQIKTKCDAKAESFAFEGAFDELVELETDIAPQVDELAYESSGTIFEQIKQRMQHFKCTSSVVVKALTDGGLKKELNEFKEFAKGVAIDFVMCNMAGSFDKIVKCQLQAVKQIPEYFVYFIHELSKTNKELANKIKEQINTKCDAKVELFAFEEASLVDGSFGNIFQKIKERMQHFKCTSSIVIKALTDGGLKDQLKEFQEFGVGVATNFFMCNLAGGIGKIVKCQLDVVKKIPEVFGLLMEDISKNNKELANKIKEEIKTKCDSKPELFAFEVELDEQNQPETAMAPQIDEFAFGSFGNRIKHFACVSAVVAKAVANGELDKLKEIGGTPVSTFIYWLMCDMDNYGHPNPECKFRKILERLPKEVVRSYIAINKEIGDKIKEQIQTKCDA